MAPLIHLFALFALSTAVLASPHVSRNVYNHAHRAVVRPSIDVDARAALPLPRRQRSLNKRCAPRPTTNSTSSAVPTSTAPINVAPLPTLPTSSHSSAAGTPSSYAPPSQAPATTTSSSSSTVAPTPTPTPTPTTTTTPPPSTPTSSTAAPAQTSSSSSNSGEPSYMTGTQSGQGTYYGTGLGACGITNVDTDYIAAVSEGLFDSFPGYDGLNPNTNPVCGRKITATYQGKSVGITVVDRCTGCQLTDLDFSPNAFGVLAALTVGRIDMTWTWT